MSYAARLVFNAWKSGDLVPRALYDRSESRSDTLALGLTRNTESLDANTKSMAALATKADLEATETRILRALRDRPR